MVEVALAAKRQCAVEVSRRIIRRQPDRFVVIGDGAVEITLVVEGVAARHEGAGFVWIDPDGDIEVDNSAVRVVLRQPHAAAIGVCPRVVGIELDRLRELAERACKVTFGAHRHTAIMMQDGEIERLVAAGIDQRRAGSDSLVVGGAPLPGAAALVRTVLCAGRSCQGEERGKGKRRPRNRMRK